MPAATLTLPTASTAYHLKTLAISAFSAQNTTAYVDRWSQIIVQSHEGNSGAIYLGGSNVDAAVYGNKIVGADDGLNLAPPNGHAHLQDLYGYGVFDDTQIAVTFVP